MLDTFIGPKSLCRWAREEIDAFEEAEKTFFYENPGTKTEDIDYRTGETVHKLVYVIEPPDSVRRGAYRIVNDLRNALDQGMYGAAKALNAPRLKYVAFPFGESRDDFRKQIARTDRRAPYQDIPAKLHPILKSFQPYYANDGSDDGDDALRSLARVANPNKHIVPLAIGCFIGARFYGGAGFITSIGPRQKWADNEVELYRTITGKHHQIDYRPVPYIALKEADRLEALATFRQLLSIVEGIVLGLEAETERLSR
jgi:hypothetical protein